MTTDSNREERSHEVKQILNAADKWRHNRRLYPGWVVLPPQNRRKLWRKTERWIAYVEENLLELKYGERIWVLEELIWRIQRCLRPLEEIFRVETSKVFYEGCESKWLEEADQQDLRRWARIGLALLTSHRWNGEYSEFGKTSTVLSTHLESFPDLQAQFEYEHALQELGQGDTKAVSDRLDAWEIPDSLPFWKIKRAGIRIETGNASDGLQEISDALKRIRQSSTDKLPSFSAASKEGFALLIRDLTRRANNDARPLDVDRWTALANYRADVRAQVEELMEQVQSSSPGFSEGSYVYEDPLTGLTSGRFSFTEREDTDQVTRAGSELAAYFERGGIPVLFHFPQQEIAGPISELKSLPRWLRGAYPWYTLSLLTRIQRVSDAHRDLGYHLKYGPVRGNWVALHEKTQSRAQACLDNLEQLRERYESLTHELIARYNLNLGIIELLLPFISDAKREKVLELAVGIYFNEKSGHLRERVRNLFQQTLKWVSRSSLSHHLPDLLRLPEVNYLTRSCDPFEYGTSNALKRARSTSEEQSIDTKGQVAIESLDERVDELLRSLDFVLSPIHSKSKYSDTDWGVAEMILWRLLRLRQAGLLGENQIKRTVQLVWDEESVVHRLVSETDLKIDQLLALVDNPSVEEVDTGQILEIAKRTVMWLGYRGKVFTDEDKPSPNLKQLRAVVNTSKPTDPLEKRGQRVRTQLWISWKPEDLVPFLDWIEQKISSVQSHRLGSISQVDLIEEIPFGNDNKLILKRLPRFITRSCIPAVQSSSSKGEETGESFPSRLAEVVQAMVEKSLPARSALSSLHRIDQIDVETIQASVNEGLGHQERNIQIDAAEAVYRFCVDAKANREEKVRLLDVLIRNVLSLATRGQGALEGVVRWLHRCIRDTEDILTQHHHSALITLLRYVSERVNPPGERERVEAQSKEDWEELTRWLEKRVQSVQLGIWLARAQLQNASEDGVEADSADAQIVELTNNIALQHPHPEILRVYDEIAEEADLTDLFDREALPTSADYA